MQSSPSPSEILHNSFQNMAEQESKEVHHQIEKSYNQLLRQKLGESYNQLLQQQMEQTLDKGNQSIENSSVETLLQRLGQAYNQLLNQNQKLQQDLKSVVQEQNLPDEYLSLAAKIKTAILTRKPLDQLPQIPTSEELRQIALLHRNNLVAVISKLIDTQIALHAFYDDIPGINHAILVSNEIGNQLHYNLFDESRIHLKYVVDSNDWILKTLIQIKPYLDTLLKTLDKACQLKEIKNDISKMSSDVESSVTSSKETTERQSSSQKPSSKDSETAKQKK